MKNLWRSAKISPKILSQPIHRLFALFVILLLTAQGHSLAQQVRKQDDTVWKVYPLPGPDQIIKKARIASSDTLSLPFWDDFSNADSGSPENNSYSPSSDLWAPGSETVRINNGLDINPPSVGIATFDGVDADGKPYSNIDTETGLADSLVSKAIDLSTVPVTERESVWLSFFWQQFGRGEFPDEEDSIRLQFKNVQNQWHTIWSRAGGDTLATEQFQQEMIQLLNPGYFHSAFQFRFQSFNRLSGAFDTWNIDYIYLNSGRSASNTAYPDRALTSLPTSPLGQYTAVPMEQFRFLPERYMAAPEVGFYNLNVQLQPVRFTALLRNRETGQIIQTLNDDIALSPIPAGFDRRSIQADTFNPELIGSNLDSLQIETEFHITSGDNFLIEDIQAGDTIFARNVDFRVNDTVRATFVLDDYFAYDDGEAEFGVELNLNGGKVAYQFVAPQEDLLTHLDIYFPPLQRNQQSVPIRLIVWETLTDSLGNEVVLRSEQAQASSVGFLDSFTRFELSSPVVVEDTFYVGYEQQGETFLAVGFDKNNDTSDKIFFNVAGAWDQNEELAGSLMMRPVFDRERKDIVLSVEDNKFEKEPLRIYPNPTTGFFRVSQPFDQLLISDIRGQQLHTIPGSSTANDSIQLNLPMGIYLLRFMVDGESISRKLIIR